MTFEFEEYLRRQQAWEDQVTTYLNALFASLCQTYITQYGDAPDTQVAYDLLLGTVFDYAVEVSWVIPPDSPEDLPSGGGPNEGFVFLGSWEVPKEYRDAFLKRIGELDSYHEMEEREERPRESPWEQPTPIWTIKQFCIRNSTRLLAIYPTTGFVKIIAGEDPRKKGYPDTTLQKRIQRLIDPKKHKRAKRPLPSEREFAELLAERMAAYDPKHYGSMDRNELVNKLTWIPAETL